MNMTAKEIRLEFYGEGDARASDHDELYIMEQYRNQSRWISVEESGLPKKQGQYLVAITFPKGIIYDLVFFRSNFEIQDGIEKYITHYQPLPEIPTE